MGTLLSASSLAVLCLLLVPRRAWAQVNMQCVTTEAAQRKRCYADRDLMLTLMPSNLEVLMPLYESYETFFTLMDPHTHCEKPALYREAVACSINVSRQCFDPDGTIGTVPLYQNIVTGMQRLCDLRDEVDVTCFKTFFNAAADCSRYNMPRMGLSMTASQKDLSCTNIELTYDCLELLMKPLCGHNTTTIYLEQLGNYNLPEFCKNGSEPTRPRQRHFPELNDRNSDHGTKTSAAPTSPISATTATAFVSIALVIVSSAHWLDCLVY